MNAKGALLARLLEAPEERLAEELYAQMLAGLEAAPGQPEAEAAAKAARHLGLAACGRKDAARAGAYADDCRRLADAYPCSEAIVLSLLDLLAGLLRLRLDAGNCHLPEDYAAEALGYADDFPRSAETGLKCAACLELLAGCPQARLPLMSRILDGTDRIAARHPDDEATALACCRVYTMAGERLLRHPANERLRHCLRRLQGLVGRFALSAPAETRALLSAAGLVRGGDGIVPEQGARAGEDKAGV